MPRCSPTRSHSAEYATAEHPRWILAIGMDKAHNVEVSSCSRNAQFLGDEHAAVLIRPPPLGHIEATIVRCLSQAARRKRCLLWELCQEPLEDFQSFKTYYKLKQLHSEIAFSKVHCVEPLEDVGAAVRNRNTYRATELLLLVALASHRGSLLACPPVVVAVGDVVEQSERAKAHCIEETLELDRWVYEYANEMEHVQDTVQLRSLCAHNQRADEH